MLHLLPLPLLLLGPLQNHHTMNQFLPLHLHYGNHFFARFARNTHCDRHGFSGLVTSTIPLDNTYVPTGGGGSDRPRFWPMGYNTSLRLEPLWARRLPVGQCVPNAGRLRDLTVRRDLVGVRKLSSGH